MADTTATSRCVHSKLLERVKFDPAASDGLSAEEVRKRWPRLYESCPDCRQQVIVYASFQHYVAGDW